jgi:hypothetical protein
MAARMAMMAMTTNNSIRVKAALKREHGRDEYGVGIMIWTLSHAAQFFYHIKM